ncbi:hypothetical protein BCON_0285g00150 [Botryotinia convoluta]|uniref:Uncharacterized protein n=1 Tax=Botryotinia convoluta TaxID=54673 RepID=A0A4Z1HKJ3_9HELO|nr:hypothetical protein BCON_0285g00150 [Botryotinia convoluta]
MRESKSRLELLPVEAIQAIQCLIENVPDLLSIILTCKAIYKAFVSAEQFILKQVLTNEIGSEVLSEAVLTALISRQVPVSDDVLDEYDNCFIENDRDIELKAYSDLRICDALFLSKLHSHVVYFTNDFISKAFASRIFTKNNSITIWQLPASDKEKRRIQRTFYHFQIYCYIVYGKKTLFPVHLHLDQNRIFFNHFSVWENEQLACVHDYMFRIIAPGFDELVDHDVEWGEYMMEYASFDDPENIEPLIARGLFAIRNMVEAKSYEQIRKAYCQNYPEYSSHLLDHGLRNSTNGSGEDEWYWLEDYSKEDDDKFINKPVWCDDNDKGPELVWRWAHQSCNSINFVLCDKHRFEREWGYVMWDYSRILELRVMENEWERTDDAENGRGSRPSRESMDRRGIIYRAGGRGWWTAEDESKVVWPDGCAPWDKPVKPGRWDSKDGRSIDEAKDFIKRLKLP